MSKKTDQKQDLRHKSNQNLKGVRGEAGPGRPKGQKNYSTLYREALLKIGESKGMTADQIEQDLVQSGILRAIKGNAVFYKDVMDRVHGKPVQPVEQKVDLNVKLSEEEKEQLDKILNYET